MSLFWLLAARNTVESASNTAEAAQTARAAQADVRELEMQLSRAMLACEAMWSILRDKLGVTDVDLVERVNQLDLSDGKLDGKVRLTPASCPKCGRTISQRFPKCMYCGQAIVHKPFGV